MNNEADANARRSHEKCDLVSCFYFYLLLYSNEVGLALLHPTDSACARCSDFIFSQNSCFSAAPVVAAATARGTIADNHARSKGGSIWIHVCAQQE